MERLDGLGGMSYNLKTPGTASPPDHPSPGCNPFSKPDQQASFPFVPGSCAMFPRIPRNELIVLSLLSGVRQSYGLDLVRQSDGALKRGSVYVTLDRMEDKGLVESWLAETPAGEQGPPRRLYRITGHGAQALAEYRAALLPGGLAFG